MHHLDSTLPEQVSKSRLCSGLVRVSAHLKPSKVKKAIMANSKSDWIGGLCPVDALHIWFSAHWACTIRRLHESRSPPANFGASDAPMLTHGTENFRRPIGHDFHDFKVTLASSTHLGSTPNTFVNQLHYT